MSWTQGIQTRGELPEKFIKWADSKVDNDILLECIVWDDCEPDIVHLDYYYKTGEYYNTYTYNVKGWNILND